MKSPDDLKVLLFDLGGVLLELNDAHETFDIPLSGDSFLDMWIHSPSVRSFESGVIDGSTFAQYMVEEARLPYKWQEFLRRFKAWPNRLYPGILQLLDAIPSDYRRGLLSNTNSVHWHQPGISSELESKFEKIFLSFQSGLLKPDQDVFKQVVDEFDCNPDQIVFFDDNPVNVEAARNIGCKSMLTRGIDELRESLTTFGIELRN